MQHTRLELTIVLLSTAIACGARQAPNISENRQSQPTQRQSSATANSEHDDNGEMDEDAIARTAQDSILEPRDQASPAAPPVQQALGLTVQRLDDPPFAYQHNETVALPKQVPMPTLRKLSQKKNQITDDEAWFRNNKLQRPGIDLPNPTMNEPGALPQNMASQFRGLRIVGAINHGDYRIALYGKDYSDGRYLVITSSDGIQMGAFDFEKWKHGRADKASASAFTAQLVQWAEVHNDVLYVSTAHRTYAESSGGLNAFLSAIDIKTGKLMWQSAPLVANARNFLIRGGWILTGYGFTSEPDALHVIDMKTGKTTQSVKLKTGPNYIIERGDRIFVRTYNTDYEFSWR